MPKQPLTQARVKQLAANPGERSKLSTGVLEKYGYGDLVRKRLLNQRLAAPVVPGSTMTGADLAHQANADTRIQYGQAQDLLARQAQAAPGYYEQYAKMLRDAGQSQATQGAQSGQAIQALYASGPNAPGSPQATLGAAQAGTASLLGDAERNYLTNLAAAAFGQGGQQRDQYLAKGAQLAREAGAFNVSDRAKIKSAEAQQVATQSIAGGNLALGAQRVGIQQQNANTAAKRASATSSHQAQTANDPYLTKYGVSRAAFLAMSPAERQKLIASTKAKPKGTGAQGNPVTGPGSLAPALENKYVSRINTAAQLLHDGKLPQKDAQGNVVYQKAKNRGEVIAWLKSHAFDPNVIGVANSLAANNLQGIGPHGVDLAHRLGIHVGGRWKVINAKPQTGAQASPH